MKLSARAASTIVAVSLIASGCGAGGFVESEPNLIVPGVGEVPPWFGLIMWDREAGAPFVLRNEFRLCLDGADSIEITNLHFEHTLGEISIDDFAVVNVEDYAGLEESDGFHLAEHGYESGHVTVDVACPLDEYGRLEDDIPHVVLGVEVSKSMDATAGARNLVVSYRTETGIERTLTWPFELVLCETDNSRGECDYPD